MSGPTAAIESQGATRASKMSARKRETSAATPADEAATDGRYLDWQIWFTAARRGDQAAYERFLCAVIPVVRGIVRARAGGLGLAAGEDVVQEVLLALHDKRHTWREGEPVEPWVYAITRYKVVDAFRRRGSRVEVPVDAFAEVIPAPAAADPTERGDFLRVVGRLDAASAELVLAVVRHGATIRDLAERFGINEGAVRVRLHRTTRRLAELRRTMID